MVGRINKMKKKKNIKAEELIAKFTIHRASKLSPKIRKDVSSWLRRQADFVEHSDFLSSLYTARFWN